MTDERFRVFLLVGTNDDRIAHVKFGPMVPWREHLEVVERGPEAKVEATKQELIAALVEVRDRCGRVAEARAIAKRVLGK